MALCLKEDGITQISKYLSNPCLHPLSRLTYSPNAGRVIRRRPSINGTVNGSLPMGITRKTLAPLVNGASRQLQPTNACNIFGALFQLKIFKQSKLI